MGRCDHLVPAEVKQIRALGAAGKRLKEICFLAKRSRWTVRRVLSGNHPACASRACGVEASEATCNEIAPNSYQKAGFQDSPILFPFTGMTKNNPISHDALAAPGKVPINAELTSSDSALRSEKP